MIRNAICITVFLSLVSCSTIPNPHRNIAQESPRLDERPGKVTCTLESNSEPSLKEVFVIPFYKCVDIEHFRESGKKTVAALHAEVVQEKEQTCKKIKLLKLKEKKECQYQLRELKESQSYTEWYLGLKDSPYERSLSSQDISRSLKLCNYSSERYREVPFENGPQPLNHENGWWYSTHNYGGLTHYSQWDMDHPDDRAERDAREEKKDPNGKYYHFLGNKNNIVIANDYAYSSGSGRHIMFTSPLADGPQQLLILNPEREMRLDVTGSAPKINFGKAGPSGTITCEAVSE